MKGSFKIAKITGIEVRVHVTFLLLVAYLAYVGSAEGGSGALSAVIFILLLFGCVLLHEFGHALAARMYGIKTTDITLLPIGGLARLERMPEKPWQELVVAIAGPMVNLVIAVLLVIVLYAIKGLQVDLWQHPEKDSPLEFLLYANVLMFLFNLIPAFPLDGGRVLRALLATRLQYARATQIAGTIGQTLALALGIYAAFHTSMILILIAIFVYMGAESEMAMVQMRNATAGLPVASAMVTRFDTLNHRSTLDQAIDALLGSSQHEFPVTDDHGGMAGLLTKNDLLLALRRSGPDTLVTEVMKTGLPVLYPEMKLEQAYQLVQTVDTTALPVVDVTGRLIGLFTVENLGELFMVKSALGNKPHRF